MKLWETRIKALNKDGELFTFVGPTIEALTQSDADIILQENGLGFCHTTGECITETDHSLAPEVEDIYFPSILDYETIQQN